MPSYVDAVTKVLVHEGGFVDDPLDRGGATNFGITQKVYEAYVGRKVTKDEIKNMPKGNAIAIYKKNYWDKVGGDSIKDYAVAFVLFDTAVNRGVSASVKQAQTILGIAPDGVAGPEFVKRLNAMTPKAFLDKFFPASENAYRQIVAKNPSQQRFLKGWLNRVSANMKMASDFLGTPVGKAAGIGGSLALLALAAFLFFKYRKK